MGEVLHWLTEYAHLDRIGMVMLPVGQSSNLSILKRDALLETIEGRFEILCYP